MSPISPVKLAQLLVGALEEIFEDAKLVHHFERRGMDGVAAEVAQEIGVFFQHDDVDAGAGEKKPEHHAGRAAAGDGASRGDLLGRHVCSYLAAIPSFRRKPESRAPNSSCNYWIPAFAGMTSK